MTAPTLIFGWGNPSRGDDALGPLFVEQMQLKDGRMWVSDRPGLGFTLSEQAQAWTVAREAFGRRP